MKYVAWAVAIILCFILGRAMYAPLGPALLAKESSRSATPADARPTVIFGSGPNELQITIDLESVSERELPSEVVLKEPMLVAARDGSQETPLESGSSVRVLRRNGSNLLVTAGGPLEGLVAIADTDFTERVIAARARRHFSATIADNFAPSTPDPTPAPGPADPVSEPEPAPPVVVKNPEPTEPEPAPEPEPEVVSVPDGDPEMEPEPAPAAGGKLNAEEIVAAMKASVQGGAIKEFTMAQVQGWKAGEEEEIDGETYQTGLAAYKAETIFGVKTVQAKALFQDGKLKKWIYSKTGMEIR